MTDYLFLFFYLQDLAKILESMKGIDNVVAVLALVIAFYAIISLKKSEKYSNKDHTETMQVIREAIVVIKDQMIDQKTALNNIQSSSLMTANLIQGNTADVRVLVTSCSEMKSDIAVLKDRRDV